MPNKMSFIFFPQILVTIGWKAFKGRKDDTVFGNKGEKRESQKNKTHYICLYNYERNDHNMLIILSSSLLYFISVFFNSISIHFNSFQFKFISIHK
jgi:hypothetical protein